MLSHSFEYCRLVDFGAKFTPRTCKNPNHAHVSSLNNYALVSGSLSKAASASRSPLLLLINL